MRQRIHGELRMHLIVWVSQRIQLGILKPIEISLQGAWHPGFFFGLPVVGRDDVFVLGQLNPHNYHGRVDMVGPISGNRGKRFGTWGKMTEAIAQYRLTMADQ
jgi:hypothetical protein